MRDTSDITRDIRALADQIELLGGGDWVDAHYRDVDIRSSDELANICGVSVDTIRRRAEQSAAAGFPLGIQHCGVWMLSFRRMMIWVERHQGQHARLTCEDQARKKCGSAAITTHDVLAGTLPSDAPVTDQP